MPIALSSRRPKSAALRLLIAAAIGMTPVLVTAAVDGEVVRFKGIARAEDGSIAYLEEHEVHFDGRQPRWSLTEYRHPDGEPFADLQSRYGVFPYLPAYHFRDRRFGREAGIRLTEGEIKGFGRRDADTRMQDLEIQPEDSLIAGQGLNYYLRDHLEELSVDGSARTVRFFMPLRGQTVTFRVERSDVGSERSGEITLRVAPESWWLRILTDGLEITYDIASGRLLRYRGPSNILNDGRESQTVDIVYRYPATDDTPAAATPSNWP